MHKNYMLKTETARKIYALVTDLPIVDYHCHLSPQEIYEDKTFDNIGEIWLAGDHYKWRLMRTAGINEEYITGNTSFKEKFIKYCSALEFAAGNPLYHWSHMELSQFFGIDMPINSRNAEEIKLGTEKAEEYTEVYCENIRRCAKYGVKCITYNFMPVFDWTRTQLDKEVEIPFDEELYYNELMKRVATSKRKVVVKSVFADTSNTYGGNK